MEKLGDNSENEYNESKNLKTLNRENENAYSMLQEDLEKKLFVGNLSWETSDRDLRKHFGKYGEIDSVELKTDRNTGRSRGFAFVIYKNVSSIGRVLSDPEHIINNKRTDPEKAKSRFGKVFVGGLPWDLSACELKDYFTQFGNVIEIEMPYNKVEQRSMGFCFITFDSEQPVADLLETPCHVIKGKKVDVKKYIRWTKENQREGGTGRDRGGPADQERPGRHVSGGNAGRPSYRGTGGNGNCYGAKGERKKPLVKDKGNRKWQHQESRKMKLRFKVSVEIDSE